MSRRRSIPLERKEGVICAESWVFNIIYRNFRIVFEFKDKLLSSGLKKKKRQVSFLYG